MAAPARPVKAGCGRLCILLMRFVMSETQDEKKARLAQALRDNLRRRKAQSRNVAREGTEPAPAPEPSKD
jgi:hypothetical protein